MKKKLFLGFAALLAIPLVACANKPNGDVNKKYANDGTSYTIPIPEPEPVYPLEPVIAKLDNPEIPAYEQGVRPYLGKVGDSHSDSKDHSGYKYSEHKVSEKLVGVSSFSFNNEDPVTPYNYIYFDVYNYSSEYSFIRFDFVGINGVEGVSVSAQYKEQEEDYHPVGILSETLLDGDLSYVADLNKFYCTDKNWNDLQGKPSIASKTVTRLYVYLDSIPSKNPSDMIGSISEITVGFYKKGEEGTQVDNSPKIATATNKGNYSITPNVPVGFSATTSTTPSGSIECDITRFTASYGTLKVNYNASNISKLAIKVDGVDKGNVSISSSGTAEFDLRGLIKVSKINFILTGSGATSFEASKIYFEVTPYCTDYWHATSRFSRCESLGIGGHVIAEYQNGVGWDYCQTKVVNWNQDFANMEVRFKLGGDKRAGLPERFGVDANSNHTIYELQFHTFEDSCVKIGDEYVVTISLAGISKLGSLNFYFDSDFIEDFSGTRRVEITSIKFLPTVPTISSMVDLLNEGCTVEHLNDSWEHITYTTKTEWDKLAATASGVNEDCKYLKVEVKPTKDVKVGIYWSPLNSPSTENQILGHTTISSEYVQTIDISSLNLPSSFSFHIFIDATIKTGGNDLQLRLSFTDQAI